MAKEKEVDRSKLFDILEKKFNAYFEPEKIKTGIIPLDLVLNGYLETGSLIELSGESQTGKSTLLMHLSKVLCEMGERVVYIDAEGSVKLDQMRGIGLEPYLSTKANKDNLFTLVKESGYNAVEEIITEFLKVGGYKLFIIDSLTALTGDIYLDLDEGRNATENRVGFEALMNSRFLKKLNGLKTEYNCIFIFINQTRIDMSGWQPAYKSSGGQAVKFFPDVRLFMKLKEKLYDKRELITGEAQIPIGANTTIEAHKSRLGLGFIPYPMTVYFGKGISNLQAYINLLPNIKVTVDGNEVPMLERLSSVSYVIHLPENEIKIKGQGNIASAVIENITMIEEYVNKYLEDFYTHIRDAATSSDEPEDVIVEEVKQEDEVEGAEE